MAHLLRRIGKRVHPCTLLPASFGGAETSLLFNTSGIRAATENPQRIKIAKDGSGSKHNRVRSANSQTKNEYGCAFVDAVSFQGHQFFMICS